MTHQSLVLKDRRNAVFLFALIPPEAIVTHAEMMRAFDAFKETNDARLASVERRKPDVLWDEKLARIERTIEVQTRRLEDLALKGARPRIGREVIRGESSEYKSAFDAYVRSGESANLRALESKALSVGSNTDGGFVVPPEIEYLIGQRLLAISPIRSIAGARTISSNVYKKPFMVTGPAVGWVGETDVRTQTASPALD